MIHGLILVDKPKGLTSHDVVARVRRLVGMRRAGHTGTLDPMATGLLIVTLGEACKLVDYLMASSKTYEATLRLGLATDTLDAEGQPTEQDPTFTMPSRHKVQAACAAFVGEFDQQVPAFSAVKVQGERLYARARRGEVVDAPTKRVRVDSLELTAITTTDISFRVRSGKGFFVRALGRDLASTLGTVGHLTALRRVGSGPWDIEQAYDLNELEAALNTGALKTFACFKTFDEACATLPTIQTTERGREYALHGKRIPLESAFIESAVEGQGIPHRVWVLRAPGRGGFGACERRKSRIAHCTRF